MENNKNYYIVGDLHGHWEMAETCLQAATLEGASVIFLGDLTDSFSKTNAQQVKTIKVVSDAIKTGDHYCLWGNHDLSYILPNLHQCSGYTRNKYDLFRPFYQGIKFHENFVPYFYLESFNILITHAGLAEEKIPKGVVYPVEYLKGYFENPWRDSTQEGDLLNSGKGSGGYGVGGITWLRPSETEKPLRESILQIVGHTPQKFASYSRKTNTFYIDTIEYGDKSFIKIDRHGNINIIRI